jgi:hypothetical protein
VRPCVLLFPKHFFMSWQIFLFALPEEFEKIRGNFEEAATSFKRKVGKCKMWYGSHFVCQFSSKCTGLLSQSQGWCPYIILVSTHCAMGYVLMKYVRNMQQKSPVLIHIRTRFIGNLRQFFESHIWRTEPNNLLTCQVKYNPSLNQLGSGMRSWG